MQQLNKTINLHYQLPNGQSLNLNLLTDEILGVRMNKSVQRLINCYEQDILFLNKEIDGDIQSYLDQRYSRDQSKKALDELRTLEAIVFAPINTYLDNLNAGKPLKVPAMGLCGRVIRGVKPDDFLTLTDDPSRRIVMLIDPDGLSALPGLSGYDVLITLGYEPDYLEHKVKEGNKFKLVVFGDGGEAKLATWDNLIDMVKLQYPEERDAFDSYISNLKCIFYK